MVDHSNASAQGADPSAKMSPENVDNLAAAASQQEQAGAPASELEKKLQDLEAQVKEKEAKYLYLYAEFENYKKRAIKERSDLMKFGWENIARELLAVIDNLERAIAHMPENTDANLKSGIEMVLGQFRTTLEKQGVLPISTGGQNFNPEIHEAMGQEPSALPQGVVTQDLVKGYTIHGRLLRPAKVVVSTGKPPTA